MSTIHRSRVISPDRVRRSYAAKVRKLTMKTFGLSDSEMVRQDKIWDRWCQERKMLEGYGDQLVNRQFDEYRALWELVNHPNVQESFKARILAILVVPWIKLSPFRYRSEFPKGNYLKGYWLGHHSYTLKVKDFSPRLQGFIAQVLEYNFEAFGWQSAGITKPSSYFSGECVEYYNKLILQVLEVLPEESDLALKLFERYRLGYQTTPVLKGGDEAFCAMLKAPIPARFKERVDAERRAMILRALEHPDHVMVRESWQDLLQGYVHDVHEFLGGAPVKGEVQVAVFLSQIDWILRLSERTPFSRVWHYDSLMNIEPWLFGHKNKELRYRFVRHLLSSEEGEKSLFLGGGRTRLHSDDDLRTIEFLIEDLGESDAELASKLRELRESYKARVAANEERLQGVKAATLAMC